eukprot:354688-Chlamydomonas_euryale.AAC.4
MGTGESRGHALKRRESPANSFQVSFKQGDGRPVTYDVMWSVDGQVDIGLTVLHKLTPAGRGKGGMAARWAGVRGSMLVQAGREKSRDACGKLGRRASGKAHEVRGKSRAHAVRSFEAVRSLRGSTLVQGSTLVRGGTLVRGSTLVRDSTLVQGGTLVRGRTLVQGGTLIRGRRGTYSHLFGHVVGCMQRLAGDYRRRADRVSDHPGAAGDVRDDLEHLRARRRAAVQKLVQHKVKRLPVVLVLQSGAVMRVCVGGGADVGMRVWRCEGVPPKVRQLSVVCAWQASGKAHARPEMPCMYTLISIRVYVYAHIN